MRKYGINNFSINLLECYEVSTEAEKLKHEQEWMNKLRPILNSRYACGLTCTLGNFYDRTQMNEDLKEYIYKEPLKYCNDPRPFTEGRMKLQIQFLADKIIWQKAYDEDIAERRRLYKNKVINNIIRGNMMSCITCV